MSFHKFAPYFQFLNYFCYVTPGRSRTFREYIDVRVTNASRVIGKGRVLFFFFYKNRSAQWCVCMYNLVKG